MSASDSPALTERALLQLTPPHDINDDNHTQSTLPLIEQYHHQVASFSRHLHSARRWSRCRDVIFASIDAALARAASSPPCVHAACASVLGILHIDTSATPVRGNDYYLPFMRYYGIVRKSNPRFPWLLLSRVVVQVAPVLAALACSEESDLDVRRQAAKTLEYLPWVWSVLGPTEKDSMRRMLREVVGPTLLRGDVRLATGEGDEAEVEGVRAVHASLHSAAVEMAKCLCDTLYCNKLIARKTWTAECRAALTARVEALCGSLAETTDALDWFANIKPVLSKPSSVGLSMPANSPAYRLRVFRCLVDLVQRGESQGNRAVHGAVLPFAAVVFEIARHQDWVYERILSSIAACAQLGVETSNLPLLKQVVVSATTLLRPSKHQLFHPTVPSRGRASTSSRLNRLGMQAEAVHKLRRASSMLAGMIDDSSRAISTAPSLRFPFLKAYAVVDVLLVSLTNAAKHVAQPALLTDSSASDVDPTRLLSSLLQALSLLPWDFIDWSQHLSTIAQVTPAFAALATQAAQAALDAPDKATLAASFASIAQLAVRFLHVKEAAREWLPLGKQLVGSEPFMRAVSLSLRGEGFLGRAQSRRLTVQRLVAALAGRAELHASLFTAPDPAALLGGLACYVSVHPGSLASTVAPIARDLLVSTVDNPGHVLDEALDMARKCYQVSLMKDPRLFCRLFAQSNGCPVCVLSTVRMANGAKFPAVLDHIVACADQPYSPPAAGDGPLYFAEALRWDVDLSTLSGLADAAAARAVEMMDEFWADSALLLEHWPDIVPHLRTTSHPSLVALGSSGRRAIVTSRTHRALRTLVVLACLPVGLEDAERSEARYDEHFVQLSERANAAAVHELLGGSAGAPAGRAPGAGRGSVMATRSLDRTSVMLSLRAASPDDQTSLDDVRRDVQQAVCYAASHLLGSPRSIHPRAVSAAAAFFPFLAAPLAPDDDELHVHGLDLLAEFVREFEVPIRKIFTWRPQVMRSQTWPGSLEWIPAALHLFGGSNIECSPKHVLVLRLQEASTPNFSRCHDHSRHTFSVLAFAGRVVAWLVALMERCQVVTSRVARARSVGWSMLLMMVRLEHFVVLPPDGKGATLTRLMSRTDGLDWTRLLGPEAHIMDRIYGTLFTFELARISPAFRAHFAKEDPQLVCMLANSIRDLHTTASDFGGELEDEDLARLSAAKNALEVQALSRLDMLGSVHFAEQIAVVYDGRSRPRRRFRRRRRVARRSRDSRFGRSLKKYPTILRRGLFARHDRSYNRKRGSTLVNYNFRVNRRNSDGFLELETRLADAHEKYLRMTWYRRLHKSREVSRPSLVAKFLAKEYRQNQDIELVFFPFVGGHSRHMVHEMRKQLRAAGSTLPRAIVDPFERLYRSKIASQTAWHAAAQPLHQSQLPLASSFTILALRALNRLGPVLLGPLEKTSPSWLRLLAESSCLTGYHFSPGPIVPHPIVPVAHSRRRSMSMSERFHIPSPLGLLDEPGELLHSSFVATPPLRFSQHSCCAVFPDCSALMRIVAALEAGVEEVTDAGVRLVVDALCRGHGAGDARYCKPPSTAMRARIGRLGILDALGTAWDEVLENEDALDADDEPDLVRLLLTTRLLVSDSQDGTEALLARPDRLTFPTDECAAHWFAVVYGRFLTSGEAWAGEMAVRAATKAKFHAVDGLPPEDALRVLRVSRTLHCLYRSGALPKSSGLFEAPCFSVLAVGLDDGDDDDDDEDDANELERLDVLFSRFHLTAGQYFADRESYAGMPKVWKYVAPSGTLMHVPERHWNVDGGPWPDLREWMAPTQTDCVLHQAEPTPNAHHGDAGLELFLSDAEAIAQLAAGSDLEALGDFSLVVLLLVVGGSPSIIKTRKLTHPHVVKPLEDDAAKWVPMWWPNESQSRSFRCWRGPSLWQLADRSLESGEALAVDDAEVDYMPHPTAVFGDTRVPANSRRSLQLQSVGTAISTGLLKRMPAAHPFWTASGGRALHLFQYAATKLIFASLDEDSFNDWLDLLVAQIESAAAPLAVLAATCLARMLTWAKNARDLSGDEPRIVWAVATKIKNLSAEMVGPVRRLAVWCAYGSVLTRGELLDALEQHHDSCTQLLDWTLIRALAACGEPGVHKRLLRLTVLSKARNEALVTQLLEQYCLLPWYARAPTDWTTARLLHADQLGYHRLAHQPRTAIGGVVGPVDENGEERVRHVASFLHQVLRVVSSTKTATATRLREVAGKQLLTDVFVLFAASSQDLRAIERCMAALDVSVDAPDSSGRTAQELARHLGNHRTVDLLDALRVPPSPPTTPRRDA